MSIYKTAVNRPITTALVFVAVAIFGVFSLSRLSIDLYPEIETNAISVITTYSGASAADVETNVSKIIENGLNSVSDLKDITSSSKENISIVTLEFEYGTDIDVATNDVRDKLDMVVSSLPDGTETPIIFKFGTEDIPIIILSVTAEESLNGLYKILDENVSTPLARVKGVGAVSISGVPEREVLVYCDPYKLEAYGLSIETISTIIMNENKNTPAGYIDMGTNTYSLRVEKEFTDAREMLDLVVGSHNGASVYLRDIATVTDTLKERAEEVYNDGGKGGKIIIQKQSGANSVNIANEIKEKLPEIQRNLPTDVKLDIIINTSDNIVNTIESLENTISFTFIIVMFVVMFFLGRWRATFVVVLTIPISLLSALIYLLATGSTLNIISMSALSIAIGMVVDNAIVVLENISSHIERGSRPKQAAIFATNEVAVSVIASTLTTVAVFLPLTMVTGMAGILFEPLGWMVTIILSVSTITAITLTPMLSSRMLKLNPNKKGGIQAMIFKPVDMLLDLLTRGYGKALNWAIHHRTVVIILAIALFYGTIKIIAPNIKTEYFPTQDNARISLKVEMPAGTRQEVTMEVGMRINDRLLEQFPEIRAVSLSGGQPDTDNVFSSMQSNGANILSFDIRLSSVEERERGLQLIGDLMRRELDKFVELKKYTVTEGGMSGGVGGQTALDIELYGHDLIATDNVAAAIAEAMRSVESCSQVSISREEYTPEYQVDFDREKLAINGLNVTTAAAYLRNRINGSISSYYREDGDEYAIRVQYAPQFRQSVEDIENITIYSSSGKGIKVRDLGTVVETMTPPTIERKNRQRIVKITCVVTNGYAISDIIADADRMLANIEAPDGISWIYGGTYEDQQDTFADMFLLMALIVILVYIVMAAQFESLTYPFVIMFSLPFALVGVLIGLYVTGSALGVMALLGILMLIGIVVNNGIVLIDYIRLCRERGLSISNSVITSGKSRLRPILMTTMTTVLGMLPMAMGTGEGSETWRSLGMSVAWGLSFSTLITLILIPVLYCIFASRGVKRQRRQIRKSHRA